MIKQLNQLFNDLFLNILEKGLDPYLPQFKEALIIIAAESEKNRKNIPDSFYNLLLISNIYQIEDEEIQLLRFRIAYNLTLHNQNIVKLKEEEQKDFNSFYFKNILLKEVNCK